MTALSRPGGGAATTEVDPLLTHRQRLIVDFLRQHLADHGYPPTFRDIASAAGLCSVSSVTHQLNQLEAKGWIRRRPGAFRAISLLDPIGEAA